MAAANPTTTFPYDANWMPAWEQRPPGEHLTTNPANATETLDPGYRTTTLPEGFAPTGPAAGVVPQWMLAQENGAVPAAGIGGGGGSGGHVVVGSLGMITVLLLVYNLFSSVGFGFMLWKGIIDWKGNINAEFLTTSRSTRGVNTSITIGVRDDDGLEWFVPLAWIETAVQRVTTDDDESSHAAIAAATVELTNTDGHSGVLPLQTLLDAAVYALRMHAAGLT